MGKVKDFNHEEICASEHQKPDHPEPDTGEPDYYDYGWYEQLDNDLPAQKKFLDDLDKLPF